MGWDIHTKLLVKECPEDFVSYFAPNARYVGMREAQYQTRLDSPYEKREMRGDLMIEAEENHEHFLINPEIQSTSDDSMADRLLGYSYEGTRLHQLNILSSVFYLRSVNKAPQPPLQRNIPNGFRSLWFNFISIEIAEKSTHEFRELNLDGFRPWMILCKDGARYEVVDEVLDYLQSRGRGNLILLTRFYADMVFTSDEDKQWIQRRFAMLQEFLWENSQVYRDILSLGTEKGIEKGIAQGIETGLKQGIERGIETGLKQGIERGIETGLKQGQIKEAHQNIETVTQVRFPDLLPIIQDRVRSMNDLSKLREVLLLISTAHDMEEVKLGLSDPS